jgi:MraZ protein
MGGFLGSYEYQMDEKGRISLPSAYRQAAGTDRFVLLQWERPYLTLYPIPVWDEKLRHLLELRGSGDDEANLVRDVVSSATEVAPDKQGRILVPQRLKEAASLSGTVLLNGNIDRVELWDPELYRTTVQGAAQGESHQFLRRVFR